MIQVNKCDGCIRFDSRTVWSTKAENSTEFSAFALLDPK